MKNDEPIVIAGNIVITREEFDTLPLMPMLAAKLDNLRGSFITSTLEAIEKRWGKSTV